MRWFTKRCLESLLSDLSPCPLPLQGKGEKKKREGEAPSLKDSPPAKEMKRVNTGSPGGTESLFPNHLPRGGTEGFVCKKMPLPGDRAGGSMKGQSSFIKTFSPSPLKERGIEGVR